MKTLNNFTVTKTIVLYMLLFFSNQSTNAQSSKPVVAVLNISATGMDYSANQCGDMVRLELEKAGQYEVLMKSDVTPVLAAAHISLDSCYAKENIINAGKLLKAEYMVGGSFDKLGAKIILRLRLINVASGATDKVFVEEFLDLQTEVPNMIKFAIQKMLGQPINQEEYNYLIKPSFENKTNNPGIGRLELNGPRMGLTLIAGNTGRRLMASAEEGGYGLNRNFMTMFGYQKEVQYLNAGRFQALFEFIPAVSGLDQNRFIPSFTFMNGFRNNSNGWEVAFGPSISLSTTGNGYYDSTGHWHLQGTAGYDPKPGTPIIEQIDKRGDPRIDFSFVLGFGKTIRSGTMNLPLNVFVVSSKNDYRFGASFGFNSKRNVQ
jgi:TolB-like protein